MRYATPEPPIVPAILPTGGSVTVQVLHQEANAVLALASNAAVESALPGVWQFSLSSITSPPVDFAQLVIVFTHSSGEKDYAKVAVKGVLDEIVNIVRLVQVNL